MKPFTPNIPTAPTRFRIAPLRSGLTLVEAVVVLVFLAAVAVVAVPRLGRANTGDPTASMRGDLAVLRNAIELYAADHGGAYPPLDGFEAALTQATDGRGPYLQVIPGLGIREPAAAGPPRVAAFPVTGPATAAPDGPPDPVAAWLYDAQTGQIRPNAAAAR